jgi:hypothetical protein
MNELAKAVLVLVLSTVVAVWLLGVALNLWPNTGQLAYGNPLPYLKVRMDPGAVRFWVEDFGGLPYERVWLYVNGQLKASGGPGTNATAKCGDQVSAVVKYYSGTKKLEGRILCTKPIKPPEGGQVARVVTTNEAIETALDVYEPVAKQTGVPIQFSGECVYSGSSFTGKVYLRVTRSDTFLVPANQAVWLQDYTFQLSENETKTLAFRLGKIGTSSFTSFAALTKDYYEAWAQSVYKEKVLYQIYPNGAVIEKDYYVYGGGTGIPQQLLAHCHVVEEIKSVEVNVTDTKEAPSNSTVHYKAILTITYANGSQTKIALVGEAQIWAYGDDVGSKITKVVIPGKDYNIKEPWQSLQIDFYDVQTNEKTGEITITRVMSINQITNLYQFLFKSEDISNVFKAYLTNRCGQGGSVDLACLADVYLNDFLGISDQPIQQLLYGKIPHIVYTYTALVGSYNILQYSATGYTTVGFLGVPDPTSLGLYFYTSPTLPIKIPIAKTSTTLSLNNNQTGGAPSGVSTQCIIDGKPMHCTYGVGELLSITKT